MYNKNHYSVCGLLLVFLIPSSYAGPIHTAVRNGNLAALQAAMAQFQGVALLRAVNEIDKETGEFPLAIAAANRDYLLIEELLRAGADPILEGSPLAVKRSAFVKAVQDFKSKHNVKLKEFLPYALKDQRSVNLRKLFFATRPIVDYLARPSSQVNFVDSHPELHSDKDQKMMNDYYEARVYELAGESFDKVLDQSREGIPYRGQCFSDLFYTSGTDSKVTDMQMNKLRARYPGVHIDRSLDIYQIRHHINQYEYPEFNLHKPQVDFGQQRFLLFPIGKDTHASTMVIVFDPARNRALAAMFLNSWESEEYYEYIRFRWNYPGYYSYSLSPLERFKGEMKARIQARLVTDGQPEPKNETYFKDYGQWGLTLFANRPIPFLDASHNLQLQPDDSNCALYSIGFLTGLAELLTRKGDSIYRLALQVADGQPEEKTQAEVDLKKIFKLDLRAYLPQYYEENGESRSTEALKAYHLGLRWRIGSEFIVAQ